MRVFKITVSGFLQFGLAFYWFSISLCLTILNYFKVISSKFYWRPQLFLIRTKLNVNHHSCLNATTLCTVTDPFWTGSIIFLELSFYLCPGCILVMYNATQDELWNYFNSNSGLWVTCGSSPYDSMNKRRVSNASCINLLVGEIPCIMKRSGFSSEAFGDFFPPN